MKRSFMILLAAACTLMALGSPASAETTPVRLDAAQVLADAADAGTYTFLLFHKDRGPATKAMLGTLEHGLASLGDRAILTEVDVRDPAHKALVDRFKVSRSPMPLVVAVAPNGAITGVFASTISQSQVKGALVTPKMAECMKSMQQGRLVFVCVSTTPGAELPQGVRDFQADPQFKGRADVVSFQLDDPGEADFLKQLKIDPRTVKTSTTAFLAPPAVLVGKYGPAATKNDMAGDLHAAGKCCNDPNCKHNHAHKAK
jgi:hypothetical protein